MYKYGKGKKIEVIEIQISDMSLAASSLDMLFLTNKKYVEPKSVRLIFPKNKHY